MRNELSKPDSRPTPTPPDPTTTTQLTRYYSLSDVATSLGRSVRSIYRDIEEGRLEATKVGAQWRVSAAQYDDYVQGDTGDADPYEELKASIKALRDALGDDQRLGLVTELTSGRR